MGTVTYTDPIHSGDRPLTAEVWSPGPRKRTLWARTPDGDWVVISMDKRTLIAPLADPRFEPCPGHMTYAPGAGGNPWKWEPGTGTRMDCARYCRDTARLDYVRMFRTDRGDFTQAERARCVALFEL